MTSHYIFVSHKHRDRDAASAIASFIRTFSGGRIKVYLSSDAGFEGPRIGKPLNDQLKKVLGSVGAVILIYTNEDEDWSYCMWECGVATDPNTVTSRIYVFQFGKDRPAPFADQFCVNVANEEDVKRFVNLFVSDEDFLPNQQEALTQFGPNSQEVVKISKDLHKSLIKYVVSRKYSIEERRAWPHMRYQLPIDWVERIDLNNIEELKKIFLKEGIITESYRSESIFKFDFMPAQNIGEVISKWKVKNVQESTGWIDSLFMQISKATSREFPTMSEGLMKEIEGPKYYLPLLVNTRFVYRRGVVEYDILFIEARGPLVFLGNDRGVFIKNGARHILLRKETLHKILESFSESGLKELGSTIGDNFAVEDLFSMMHTRVSAEEDQTDLVLNNTQFLLDEWIKIEREAGWGTFEAKINDEGIGSISIKHSFLTQPGRKKMNKLCAFLEGYFSKVLSRIYSSHIIVKEINCAQERIALPVCEFEVTHG